MMPVRQTLSLLSFLDQESRLEETNRIRQRVRFGRDTTTQNSHILNLINCHGVPHYDREE